MWCLIVFCILCAARACDALQFDGPFLLWGPSQVEQLNVPALTVIQDEELLNLFAKVNTVYVFSEDASKRDDNNSSVVNAKQLVGSSKVVYLTQPSIPDPSESGTEVLEIVLNRIQQFDLDRIKEHFDLGNVLGILALGGDKSRKKRETDEGVATADPTEEPMQEDFIYKADGKAILYTTSAPTLTLDSNATDGKPLVKELRTHGIVTVDEREQFWRLSVTFAVDGGKTTLRFKFPILSGYWSLNSVEVVDKDFSGNLTVVGDAPEAPVGFSHICSRQLVFKSGLTNLTLSNVQVQPLMSGANRFSEAIDCIGFTTVPIWSGVFVSFIILIGTSIGIIAIMDIKTPNRFESSRSKQLTFTVQE